MSSVLIVSTIVVVGIAVSAIISIVNRRIIRSNKASSLKLKKQASALPKKDIFLFLKNCVPDEEIENARIIMEVLASTLNIEPERLADDYQLDVLFVDGVQEPFAYDIFEGLLKVTDKDKWQERFQNYSMSVKGENEIINQIMKMRMSVFLKTFSPIVKNFNKR